MKVSRSPLGANIFEALVLRVDLVDLVNLLVLFDSKIQKFPIRSSEIVSGWTLVAPLACNDDHPRSSNKQR
jgi:hypothetical protein